MKKISEKEIAEIVEDAMALESTEITDYAGYYNIASYKGSDIDITVNKTDDGNFWVHISNEMEWSNDDFCEQTKDALTALLSEIVDGITEDDFENIDEDAEDDDGLPFHVGDFVTILIDSPDGIADKNVCGKFGCVSEINKRTTADLDGCWYDIEVKIGVFSHFIYVFGEKQIRYATPEECMNELRTVYA